MSILNRPYFQDEEAAHQFLEGILWPQGAVCPHCGVVDAAYKIAANPEKRVRYGLWKCRECRKQFTVKVGTVFEHARLPLYKALQAVYLLCSSKKGISANQISRALEISLKAAWFLAHRVREAMAPGGALSALGGEGMFVEADTTYIGGKEKNKHVGKRNAKNIGGAGKMIVHTLVERSGKARSHHIANVSGKTLRPILLGNVDRKSALMTDTAGGYMQIGKQFARHEMVDHGRDEYVRGDAHSNTVEGYFATLKRGITGVYHHVSEAHLSRYLAEFDFRHSHRSALGVDDFARTIAVLAGVAGKRLTYSQGINN